jgi:Tol biopolymer transport system component
MREENFVIRYALVAVLCAVVIAFTAAILSEDKNAQTSSAIGFGASIRENNLQPASRSSGLKTSGLADQHSWLSMTLAEGNLTYAALLDPAGGQVCRIKGFEQNTSAMAWSHDGNQMIIVRGNPTVASDLVLVSLQGENRALTNGSARNYAPSWSWDDRLIAFVSTRSGSPQIYTLDLSSNETRQISSESGTMVSDPVWGPDNTLYYVEGEGDQSQIFTYNLDTRSKRALIAGSRPNFSPDGSQLLFVSRTSQPSSLHRYSVADDSTELLIANGGEAEYSTWSPDGTQIAYITIFADKITLFTANADGSNPLQAPATRPIQWNALQWRYLTDEQISLLNRLISCTGDRPSHQAIIEPIKPDWELPPTGWWIYPRYMPASDASGRRADIITLSGPIWGIANNYSGFSGNSGEISILLADPLMTAEFAELTFDQESDPVRALQDLVRIFYRGQTLNYVTQTPQRTSRFGRDLVSWDFDTSFGAVTTLLMRSSDGTWFYGSLTTRRGEREQALEEAGELLGSLDYPAPPAQLQTNTPEYAAAGYISAIADGDLDKALEFSCLEARALNEIALTIAGPLEDLVRAGFQLVVEATNIDVSNLRYQTVNLEGNRAFVRVGGNIALTNIETNEHELWPYWQYVNGGKDYIQVVYELGEWRICS